MTKVYYIYEIWGKKIGCAENLERRMREQNVFDGRYNVLEVHTDIMLASQREIELQKQYGYSVDKIPYYVMCNNIITSRDKINQKARVAKVDWKAAQEKRLANTDFKTRTANTDYKKKVANTDYKARDAKIDWKARTAKIDWESNAEKHKKSINQYSLEGTFIKNWDSAVDAGKELNVQSNGIGMCCRNVIKTSAGYIWKFAN